MPSESQVRPASRFAEVEGSRMHYLGIGRGDPVLFLHGHPTSSYLWRNVLPRVSQYGRCIALDLIGMGRSDKPDIEYRFFDHVRYAEGFIEKLGLKDITLVVHDWGSALGFNWANDHRERVPGIAYMEGIVAPVSWSDWPEGARDIFQAFRSEAGEDLVLNKNIFIERVLPSSIIRELDETEMSEYRRPFSDAGESRRPTLTWPRQIPLGGEPEEVVEIVQAYADWLAASDVPSCSSMPSPAPS